MTCACSAGPAFEGGDISCGMRATDGAIEAVTIDCATMEPTFTIVGEEGQKPVGLCGSGIIDMIAELFRCGIINAKGLFVREGSRVQRDQHGTGRYILATPAESATGREISLTEVDIESFIRAKGAIYSAIDTLLSSMDMDASVLEHVYVAGGIGSGINMKNAIFIGMFPAVELSKYEYVGQLLPGRCLCHGHLRSGGPKGGGAGPEHDLRGAVHPPGVYGQLCGGLLPAPHRRLPLPRHCAGDVIWQRNAPWKTTRRRSPSPTT